MTGVSYGSCSDRRGGSECSRITRRCHDPDPGRLLPRRFYEDVLGFPVQRETPTTIYCDAGGGTFFAVSRSGGKSSGGQTQMALRVDDIQGEVSALRANGVSFEEYETPRTVDGIADMGAGLAALAQGP
jgi:catechol 2,3-dioxygenase-like lactoylglutathione lyase family enzyme